MSPINIQSYEDWMGFICCEYLFVLEPSVCRYDYCNNSYNVSFMISVYYYIIIIKI